MAARKMTDAEKAELGGKALELWSCSRSLAKKTEAARHSGMDWIQSDRLAKELCELRTRCESLDRELVASSGYTA
jgi:hypothetical protein